MFRTIVRRRIASVVLLLGVLMAPHALAGRGRPVSGRTYVVRAGDTIWEIARRAVGSEGDPRPLVDRLIRVNHLEDGIIFPGERLAMPPDLKTGR